MKNKYLSSVIVKVNKDDLLKINYLFTNKAYIKSEDETFFYLEIKEKDLAILSNNNINYEIVTYKGLRKVIKLWKKNLSIFIGIILFALITFVNTLTIKEITFSTYTKDNEKIKQLIDSYMTNIIGINFLKEDINDINLRLRKEFSNYEWIAVEKKGSKLHVTLLEPSIINKQVQKIEGYGDLIAKKDGIIKYYQVRHGIVLVEHNQFVRAGDVLVSGNLRYHNYDESTFYVPAEGVVYAEVWYTETIIIPKEIRVTEYTGKISKTESLNLFGLDIKYHDKKHQYENYDTIIDEDFFHFFSIKLPFGIKKIHYLEKNDIIHIYDEMTACEKAKSEIRYEKGKSFTDDERIISIELIKKNETKDDFSFTFFIKTYENIAEFQRR